VWFDALLNYVTAAGYLQDEARFARLWPQAHHLIGKDILTTHSVYWPTMLKAAGLPMPRTIFATGWWTVDGEKISKSRGNAVKPLELASI
jgi:methionyl-tRNA synthetase